MEEKEVQSPLTPRHRQFGRSSSATALWGHLLQKNTAADLRPQMSINSSANPPLAPTDRLGTSMRILLHDTQATLEKFSERLETLTNGVDKTHQNINVVQKLFEREHESFIEENVALVNRCQLEIQKSLGKPAQAQEIKELQERLASVDRRLEALDNRFDVLHLLNQTQSQTLQALQDQQTQLNSSLAPVLPLLQAIPLHVNTAKLEIKECIKDARRVPLYARNSSHGRTTASSSQTLVASVRGSSGALAPSSPAPVSASGSDCSRKRRRTEDLNISTGDLFDRGMEDFPQQSLNISSQPTKTQDLALRSNSGLSGNEQLLCLSAPPCPGSQSPHQNPAPVDPHQSAGVPSTAGDLLAPNPGASPAPVGPPDLSTIPSHISLCLSNQGVPLPDDVLSPPNYRITQGPYAAVHQWRSTPSQSQRQTPDAELRRRPTSSARSADAPARFPATPIRVAGPRGARASSIQQRSSRRSRFSAGRPLCSPPMSSPTERLGYSRDTDRTYAPGGSACVHEDGTSHSQIDDPNSPQSSGNGADLVPTTLAPHGKLTDHVAVREVSSTGRPMSLKDRKAHGLLTDTTMSEGKRYILLDDEDEDEFSD